LVKKVDDFVFERIDALVSVFGIDDMPPVTLKTVEYGKLALGIAHGIHKRCAHEHRAAHPRRQCLEATGNRIGDRRAGEALLIQSRNRQRDSAAKALAPCKDAVGVHAIKIARSLRQRATPTDALDKSGRGNPLLQIVRTSNIVIQRENGIPHGGKSRHVMPATHRPIDIVKHQAQWHALRYSGTTNWLNQTSVDRIVTEFKGNLRVTGAGVNKVNRRNGQALNLKIRSACL